MRNEFHDEKQEHINKKTKQKKKQKTKPTALMIVKKKSYEKRGEQERKLCKITLVMKKRSRLAKITKKGHKKTLKKFR